MPPRRFTQVDLFASDAAKAVTPSRGEDPRTPHIKQFSDGYRVWNPMVRNYVGDAHMQPFRDVGAASVLQRALYMEMAASGSAPARIVRRAEAMRAEGSDLFGASAAVRSTGEQRGFKFNGAMAASKANPFVVVDNRGRREIPAVFPSRKEAGLARRYLEAAEGARGLRVRATTAIESARKRNGSLASAATAARDAATIAGYQGARDLRDAAAHIDSGDLDRLHAALPVLRAYARASIDAGTRRRLDAAADDVSAAIGSARKRNGASRVPPPRSLIHVEILAGGYGGTADPAARITRFTAVTPLEGYGKKAKSHRFPINELVARAASGRVVLDGKKVVGVVFTNVDRNDSGASVAARAVAALAREIHGDPNALRVQVNYAKRNDPRRSRMPEPSFDTHAYGRPIYADEARPAKPSRRSAEDYEAISMLKPNGARRHDDTTVRLQVAHLYDEGAPLLRAMEENGLRIGKPFGILELKDDRLINELTQAAVDVVIGEPGIAWDEALFDDGTQINDPGLAQVTVHRASARPGGLMGTSHAYDVTVHFPPKSRYMPAKENPGRNPTNDSFVVRDGDAELLVVNKMDSAGGFFAQVLDPHHGSDPRFWGDEKRGKHITSTSSVRSPEIANKEGEREARRELRARRAFREIVSGGAAATLHRRDPSFSEHPIVDEPKPNPGRRTLPATVERCVAHVGPRRVEELGPREGLSSAIAICTAQGQRRGQLHKGTRTPTKKGRRDERNASRRVGFADDERTVARMAKAARKKNGAKRAASGDVFVYRNLHTGTWSVKALRGPSKGRVVGHPDDVTVANVEFRVNAAGRDRVRAECVKGVHAGVVGTIDESGIPADYPAHLVVEVGYNPFLFDSFVLLANRVPLHRAAFVRMPPQPRGGARPLVAALYPEDAHILDVPPVTVDPDRAARMRDCRERNAKRGGRRRG